jgi:hypothetical protein
MKSPFAVHLPMGKDGRIALFAGRLSSGYLNVHAGLYATDLTLYSRDRSGDLCLRCSKLRAMDH